MPTLLLPYQRDPIAGGFTTPNNWYEFFRAVKQTLNESGLDPGVISDIQARLAALEAESSGFTMQGLSSVSVFGTPEGGLVRVELNNDDVAPGNTYYYGTDSAGVKGWHTVRSALDFGDGIDLTTGSDGVTEISFNAATAEIASLPGATYKTVQKAIDVLFSPGIITGGEITELTTTSVRITGGTAIVRIADDNVSELRFFDFASQDFTLPDDQVTRFYALSYNGGSPTFIESVSSEDWDRDTELPAGSAFRAGPVLNITPNPYKVGDIITNFLQRLDAIGPVQRDNSVGGLQLGETGTRNVTLTGGKLWSRISDFPIANKNSATDTMVTSYYNGTNTTVTAGVTQWDNLQFNNTTTGTLQTLGNNKYANLWFFMSFNGDHYGFAYGTNEYNTIGDAANEGVPSHFTQNFFNQFILLGRFIFQKSASTAAVIESAFATPLTTQAINTHNNLGGLQGGTTGEFYHLTSAEYTKVQALPSASQPLDATLTALAGQNWAANALPIGSGADTVAQVSFAANTLPARASTGNLVAKSVTDQALTLLATTNTTNLPEGSNLYFTDGRAQTAVVTSSITNGDTTHAPSGDAVFDTLALKADLASPAFTGNPTAPTPSDNDDDTSIATTEFVNNAMPKGYIDGLSMVWVSGTALTVTTGSAYIESLGRVVRVTSDIAKTSLSLSASTWYHVYLYLNAGNPDVDIVTTDPSAAYSGTARSKTGDTSKRYIGSIRTTSSGDIWCFRHIGNVLLYDVLAAGLIPFRVLSNGTSTTPTTVSVSDCIPSSGGAAIIKADNTASNVCVVSIGRNSSGGSVFQGSVFNGQRAQWIIGLDGSQFSYAYNTSPTGGGVYFDIIGYMWER